MIENSSKYSAMEYNSAVEGFQDKEYPMLQKTTYLDHGGTTLYAKSLIETVAADLVANLYGNPHSASTPARLSGRVIDEARERALRFFGADPEYFDLIFVANATAAIKLVADSFRDVSSQEGGSGFWYGYHVDSHNSLVGVRECSDENHHLFTTDAEVDSWLSSSNSPINPSGKLGLFAYPGQSNMTGRRLPLHWASKLRSSTNPALTDTYTLLDAAALATTSPLHHVFADPATAPDFTALSFYKIFGYPDLGGLIVRKASGQILTCRRYFGGGTIALVTVHGERPWHESREGLHESLEDGTLPFHSIIALKAAIQTHERLYGGADCMRVISRHTAFLIKRLHDAVAELRHANGEPVIKIYTGVSGESTYGDPKTQGPTISFNVFRDDGSCVPYMSAVERAANERNIFVRSGQLCNPGGVGMHMGFEKWHYQRLWASGYRCGEQEKSGTEIFRGKATGVVRASLGAMTTKANVDRLVLFLRDEFALEKHVFGRSMTLEEGIALVIREEEEEEEYEESFSEISEKVGSSEMRSDSDGVPEPQLLKNELGSYEMVPHSFSTSTTQVNHSTPVHSTPVHSTPVQSMPVHLTSVESMPVQSVPVQSMPVHSAPVHSAPVHSAPVHSAPVHSAPVHSAPVHPTPLHSAPLNSAPLNSTAEHPTLVHPTPVHSTQLNSTPLNSTPLSSTPVHPSPVHPTPVHSRQLNSPPPTSHPTLVHPAPVHSRQLNSLPLTSAPVHSPPPPMHSMPLTSAPVHSRAPPRPTSRNSIMAHSTPPPGSMPVGRANSLHSSSRATSPHMSTPRISSPRILSPRAASAMPAAPAPTSNPEKAMAPPRPPPPLMSGAITEEKRRPVVHVISLQEFEMSRSKLVMQPTTAARKSVLPKDEGQLRKLLSSRGRLHRTSSNFA